MWKDEKPHKYGLFRVFEKNRKKLKKLVDK